MLQAVARALLPKERVKNCLRVVQKGGQAVTVWRSSQHQRAHYKGLQTCSSVWHCPVCAAKISERRRTELDGAIAVHRAMGGDVLLLTLTNSHHKGHRLAELLDGQKAALVRFWSGRAGVALFKSMNLVGSIRALEVLHGSNGWHPHYHILLFISEPLRNLPYIRNVLAQRWLDCCRAAGLPLPDLAHGVDLQDASYAAGYVAKWGMSEEMTRGHTKSGKTKGQTPWDLLRNVAETGEAEPAALFQEYAKAFKGKRQLFWSPGLKARLAVENLTDEEIVAQVQEDSLLLGRLDLVQWRLIVRANARAKILDAAEQGWPAVVAVLEAIALEFQT